MSLKFFLAILPIVAFSFSTLSIAAEEKSTSVPVAKTKNEKAWNTKMQDLYRSLSEILIDTSSDTRFNSAANFKRIDANAKKLKELAHDINAMTAVKHEKSGIVRVPPDFDPTLQMVTTLFSEETSRAYSALKSGHRSYARSVLRTVTSYCITCHTRTNSGPDLSKMPVQEEVKNLRPIERAEFLASTRRNEEAIKELENIISDTATAKDRSIEWERAIRYALAISVRVTKNPDTALKIVDKVLSEDSAPAFVRKNAEVWKKSLEEWKNEINRKPKTDEGYYAEAVRLLAKAKEIQKYPADRSADVVYLRLTTVVHELLSKYPQTKYSAESLFLLGISYETLREMNLWTLHEMYYEGCIRKAPNTEIAQGCYRHFEQTMYEGYSGSGGVSIPLDVAQKLKELRAISGQPEAKKIQ